MLSLNPVYVPVDSQESYERGNRLHLPGELKGPNDPLARQICALLARSEVRPALRLINQHLAKVPEDARALYLRARAEFIGGNPYAAREDCKRALGAYTDEGLARPIQSLWTMCDEDLGGWSAAQPPFFEIMVNRRQSGKSASPQTSGLATPKVSCQSVANFNARSPLPDSWQTCALSTLPIAAST